MPVDIRRRRLRDVDETIPGDKTDLDINISDNGNSDENKSVVVDSNSDADITLVNSDDNEGLEDDNNDNDGASIDLNSSRLVDLVLSAKNAKNPPKGLPIKVLLDDAVTKDKLTTDTATAHYNIGDVTTAGLSTAQHKIGDVTTADVSTAQNNIEEATTADISITQHNIEDVTTADLSDSEIVSADPGDEDNSDDSLLLSTATTHTDKEGNNPHHRQQLDSFNNPQQHQLPDIESRVRLSKTELPYLNERLITTRSPSQASEGQGNSSGGQEDASTVSSFVKRTTEGIREPLLESSTNRNHSGTTSIDSTSTRSITNGSISTDSITNIDDTLVDATSSNSDKQDQDSLSDNDKEIDEKTVDSDTFSEMNDASSDSSTIKDSNNNNLDNDLLTSRIHSLDVDDEMSLQGGKVPSKHSEANDNDENGTLKIDLVTSGNKTEDRQNLGTDESVENEDYDYSYYGDMLDFGDSSDDYIGEGERLAKMIEQPAEVLPDEDYYEYNYEDGTIKIPFNYSGLQSTGLSSMPRSWDAKVAFLEQVGMRLYMFIPGMAGGVLLGLLVWLFTIFIIRSYGTVKVKIFGQNKQNEHYRLEKIDKDSLPVRGDQRRDSDRRKQRVAGGDLFTSFNEKSPPPVSVHPSVVPCYIPEPDYGHDNDAYMSTEELNNKDDISPYHLHNEKDDILCHSMNNNNNQEKSAKILDVHNSADYSLDSRTDITGVDEEVHSLKSATSSSSGIGNSEKGSLDLSETKSSVTNDISLLDEHQLSMNETAVGGGGQTASLKDVEINKDSINLNRRKSD